MSYTASEPKALSRRISRWVWRARAQLVFERYGWIAAPFVAALLLFMAGSFTGLWERIGDPWRLMALIFVFALFIRFLLQARKIRFPSKLEAEARLERDSGLSHRPIQTLRDHPARLAGTEREGSWARHREIALEKLSRARPSKLRPTLAPRDKYYLRFIIPATAILGLMVGMGDSGERLRAALSPSWLSAADANKARFDGWVNPPEYTGRPPLYFKNTDSLTAPEGSEIVVRVSGLADAPRPVIKIGGSRARLTPQPSGENSFQVAAILNEDAVLSWRVGSRTERFKVKITPDSPPEISFDKNPEADKRDRLVLAYSGSDDIGITELYLEMTRTDDPSRSAERVALPLPGASVKTLSETEQTLSLAKHKWAGRQVSGRLIAIDGAGQEAISAPEVFGVPDRIFIDPLAKAVVEQRSLLMNASGDYAPTPAIKDQTWPKYSADLPEMTLARAPGEVRRAFDLMDAVLDMPAGLFEDVTAFMGLRYVKQRIAQAESLSDISALDETLWDIAMRIEFGPLGDAKAEMMIAEQNLRDGIARRVRQREMDALFQRYNDAVDRYIEYLTENAETVEGGGGQGGPPRNVDEIQELLDAIEEATRRGDTAGARRALAQLAELLENMRIQRTQGGGEGSGEGEPNDGLSDEAEDAIEDLAENLGQQRRLQDETRRAERAQEQQSQNGEPSGQDGQNGGQNGQEERGERSPEELARDQQALRQGLDGIEDRLREGDIDMDAVPQMNTRPQEDGTRPGSSDQGEPRSGPGAGEIDPDAPEGFGAGEPDENARGGGGGTREEMLSAEEALERAREAMRLAEEALERGDFEAAQAYQDEAIAMMRAISRAVVAQSATGQQQDGQAGGRRAGNDPFGRDEGEDGTATDDADLPQKSDRQRARELIDELRERAAEQDRDSEELDYLERLLERF